MCCIKEGLGYGSYSIVMITEQRITMFPTSNYVVAGNSEMEHRELHFVRNEAIP